VGFGSSFRSGEAWAFSEYFRIDSV
jgi:hypothetical protein